MNQELEFSVWIGSAVLAFGGAGLYLWHTSRVLIRLRSVRVPKDWQLPVAGAEMASPIFRRDDVTT